MAAGDLTGQTKWEYEISNIKIPEGPGHGKCLVL
jgi:hypothetical protein